MALVLDSGALLAYNRGSKRVATLIRAAQELKYAVATSAGCVAETWRAEGPKQALLARLLKGVKEVDLDRRISRQIGILCGRANINDIVDAHVATLTVDSDTVITSDPSDIEQLLATLKVRATVERC